MRYQENMETKKQHNTKDMVRKQEIQENKAVNITVRHFGKKVNSLRKSSLEIVRVHMIYLCHQNRLISPYQGR